MTEASSTQKYLTVRQASFIGVGAMVGAGIFALLGAAGEVAGAAVWVSFLIAGAIAGLQGCSSTSRGGSATGTSPASPRG
jgi:amino acid transporter